MKTRFAPSPTGLMHFGNLRTALFNFLLAKKNKGVFLLRIEDTDKLRSKKEYVDSLLSDLKKVNIDFQEGPFFQSDRIATYEKYYKILIDKKLAYPCFCSEESLALARKVQLSSGLPPRYSGKCRNLSNDEIEKKLQEGLKPALRFKVPKDENIEFIDLIKGNQRFLSNDIGDFIIRRADLSSSFMFSNAVDDSLMNVTDALRGEDHITNTPRQIMILQALDLRVPNYGHFPLINGEDGAPLSKRNGSESVFDLLENGYFSLALINYLARLGHYYENNALMSIDELASRFDLSNINSSAARHDLSHLSHWQKEVILKINANELLEKIKDYLPDDLSLTLDRKLQFVNLIKPNILMPDDSKIFVEVLLRDNFDFFEFFENFMFSKVFKFSKNSELSKGAEHFKDVILNTGIDFFKHAYEFLENENILEDKDTLKNKDTVKDEGVLESKGALKDNEVLESKGVLKNKDILKNKTYKDTFDFSKLIKSLKKEFNLKGKKLFLPIRLALTGLDFGPELIDIVDFLGVEEVKRRFKKVIEIFE